MSVASSAGAEVTEGGVLSTDTGVSDILYPILKPSSTAATNHG